MLIQSVRHTLGEIDSFLSQLTHEQYNFPCPELSGSSIGQHTRHIIEVFQCLLIQYDRGEINYDSRQRNATIETLPSYARSCIQMIRETVDKPDKFLALYQKVAGREIKIATNYYREILYNLEHCIHHQALIRVAVMDMDNVEVDENFGLAPATIEYRQCAQ
ncbi:hypothetical protein DYBT9623_02430 [Dyadobacter sp. CECT 9623]|uniref:DinB-like domain-containing protein n=1 Tax=Dyadobacter linearis TaxID=2823330 RepID=A0ABM8UQF3_9BACT|nr:DinB family protein [Dyadobacter sp. CECT 9623]CAG5069693.1 hypothetical protein DYBT9623_02430 [Dyadobacter sp. CECT 9623]